jgi:hypothetical protein
VSSYNPDHREQSHKQPEQGIGLRVVSRQRKAGPEPERQGSKNQLSISIDSTIPIPTEDARSSPRYSILDVAAVLLLVVHSSTYCVRSKYNTTLANAIKLGKTTADLIRLRLGSGRMSLSTKYHSLVCWISREAVNSKTFCSSEDTYFCNSSLSFISERCCPQ